MQTIKDIKVVTRKEHKCLCCSKTIEKGATVRTQTNTEDGEIWTVRFCDDCNYLVKEYPYLFEEDDTLREDCVSDKFSDYEVASAAELRQKLSK
jgi:hypothetical protein